MEAVTLLAGTALVGVLVMVPGRAFVRGVGLARDGFTTVMVGVAIVSVVGLLLARAQWFSLVSLVVVLAGISLAGWLLARRRPGARLETPGGRAVPLAVAVVAMGAFGWCWPPFETVLAGSDSTMYVNAGIHLARTGSLAVESSAVDVLGAATAAGVFPSVRADGNGPFIRLPGGLLMSELTDDSALPAFFPLLPVWTGIAALAWGPEGAPAIAPLSVALAVSAVTLFAAESFGLAVGAVTGVLLVANFAFWWFGRFLMPEPLACAFVWSALVFLRRGAVTTAGVMFGLAGLARAETMLLVVAAVGLWLVWERPALRLDRLLLGFGPLAALTGFSLLGLPSHHRAYLWNDVAMLVARSARGVPLGATSALVAVLVVLTALAGVLLALRGRGAGVRTLRAGVVLGVAAVLLAYLLVGGDSDPIRSVRWLAAYCSWPLLGLALAGAVVIWRRRDPVARFALLLSALVALVFVINPRVAPYHPWAIRRFLPIVIPGLTIAAATAIGVLAAGGTRGRRAAIAMVVLALALLEVRPVQAIRHRRYFVDGFRTAETVAEMLPLDAFVVIDSRLSDVQIQVPLWLVHRRETVAMAPASANWRASLFAVTDSERPAYWIDGRFAYTPRVSGLVFERILPDPEIDLRVPNSGRDGPPQLMIGRRYPLRMYRVSRAQE